jgi:putrescine transport system permease protein
MVLLVIVPLAVFSRYQAETPSAPPDDMLGSALNRSFARSWLALGYAFLYVPIVALVVYSFNDSPVANVWRGFTLEWYRKLADDRELLAGLALSLKVALTTACASVVLGTLAAFALVRYRRFFGSTLFAGMVAAPARHARGDHRPVAAADAGLAAARDRGGVRRGLSRARPADDLARPPAARHGLRDRRRPCPPADAQPAARGRPRSTSARGPWQVFWLVTLPMIGQALLSAFLLTFTLSLDDVVLSAFLSGPGATTMPLVIFSRARLGLNPSVNAVATIIIAVVAVGVVVASFLIARNERRRALDAATAQRPEAHEHVARAPRTGLPQPRRRDGDRRRLRRLLEGAGHRLSVFLLAGMRFAIAAVAMAPWLRRPAGEPALDARSHRLLFLESFFGNFPVLDLHAVRHPPEHRARRPA